MPRAFATQNRDDLVEAELDVRTALGSLQLDLGSLAAVSNIFRAATAVRNHMERTVLAEHDLSWSAFVVLFVLRVWGEQDSSTLAGEAGITAGTLTGVMKTLEKKRLAARRRDLADRRRVIVSASARGRRVVDEIMPGFNRHEALVTRGLTPRQRDQLSSSLRAILRTVEDLDAGPDDGEPRRQGSR